MQAEDRDQRDRNRGKQASPERHENYDDQIEQGDRPGLEVEPYRSKRDQCQADDAKQKMCGGMPESMGRGFWRVRPIRRRMSIVYPAHPTVPAFLGKMTKEFPHGLPSGLSVFWACLRNLRGRNRCGADLLVEFQNIPNMGSSRVI